MKILERDMQAQIKEHYKVLRTVPHGDFEDIYFEEDNGVLFLLHGGVDGFTICEESTPTNFTKVESFDEVVKFVA